MNFTVKQAAAIKSALHAFALSQGATEQDLLESANALGEGHALRRHIERVTRALQCSYQSLSAITQNVLECCRYVAGALAFTVPAYEWEALDRDVWAVALSAV